MTIRELLKSKPEQKVELVKYQDSEFTVKGISDGSIMINLTSSMDQYKNDAKHYNALLKKTTIDGTFVMMANAILLTLEPEDPKKPYQIHEIIEIGCNHGLLFSQLAGAAMKVLGLTEASEELDPISKQAVGN